MIIPGGLQEAKLIRRYQRFLADVSLAENRFTIHCPNTGSMKNCAEPGSRVWFSTATNPARKYPHTWEVVEVAGRWLAGVNTGRANKLVTEALQQGLITELADYKRLRTEVAYGEGSRIDILLEDEDSAQARPPCHVEVKNVTLLDTAGLGLFPDAVTLRGQKHLRELSAVVDNGGRAVLMFCVQHSGIQRVAPADRIDPEYGRLLREAKSRGVEILAYRAEFDLPKGKIVLEQPLPVLL